MKIDFHSHVKLKKHVPFSREYTEHMFKNAIQAGLDAICLTEHYSSSELDSVYQYLQDCLEKTGDCFLFEGLKIFTGIEVDIAEGGHIVVIGPIDDILTVYEKLEERAKIKDHPSFELLIEIIKQPSLLIGGGHPFRPIDKCVLKLQDHQMKQLDYIELSGNDLALYREQTEAKTRDLAKRVGLPLIIGSDTHQAFQYGCAYTCFKQEHITVASLKQAIVKGEYTLETSEFAERQAMMASKMKKALVRIHDLGDDYVSIIVK